MENLAMEIAKSIVEKVIVNCQTVEQFGVAKRMIDSYSKNYNDENGVIILNEMIDSMEYETNIIINWELHQKNINKKRSVTFCVGIGLNQFFPEYITIDLDSEKELTDISWVTDYYKTNN